MEVIEIETDDPYSRGIQIGQAFRVDIKRLLLLLLENYRKINKIDSYKTDKYLKECLKISEIYYRDLVVEMKGIAKGAGLQFKDILFLNAFLEHINFKYKNISHETFGCTIIGSNRHKQNIIVAQNYDMEQYYEEFVKVIILHENNKKILLVTFAGIVGCIGMNSKGISININYLHSKDIRTGILYPFVIRKALNQETVGEAIGAVTTDYKASGMNYLISDRNGVMIDIETTSRYFDLLYPNNNIISHSNHYKSSVLKKYDRMVFDLGLKSTFSRRGSTIVRDYISYNNMLNEEHSLENIKKIMCNHISYPYSICKHPENKDQVNNSTVFSTIFELNKCRAHITTGPPCKNSYNIYDLK